MNILVSFLPWIIFWVLSGKGQLKIAAAASIVAVVILAIKDFKKHSVKILDIGTFIFFVAALIFSFTSTSQFIDNFASPLSNAFLFIIALTSIIIKKPFTIQYAREQVDSEFWDSPIFYSINLAISWVWCGAFAVIAITSYIALNHPYLIDRIIHILAFVFAIRFSSWYPEYVKKSRAGE